MIGLFEFCLQTIDVVRNMAEFILNLTFKWKFNFVNEKIKDTGE